MRLITLLSLPALATALELRLYEPQVTSSSVERGNETIFRPCNQQEPTGLFYSVPRNAPWKVQFWTNDNPVFAYTYIKIAFGKREKGQDQNFTRYLKEPHLVYGNGTVCFDDLTVENVTDRRGTIMFYQGSKKEDDPSLKEDIGLYQCADFVISLDPDHKMGSCKNDSIQMSDFVTVNEDGTDNRAEVNRLYQEKKSGARQIGASLLLASVVAAGTVLMGL
ncbi:hypothetical protein BJ508DRAFT_417423 [Ascobolus immersus RN42]|uniref:Copper acquisition factor BIM1-like domain-containing protein n=1 Tax=Ascobolus immersus RN42 TaxID=1160509 RepID=A0A3N4HSM7_ASCIM|nr:hypothetical protein BJ508DRAFT_417423 [Ascobolus immersus RN42]